MSRIVTETDDFDVATELGVEEIAVLDVVKQDIQYSKVDHLPERINESTVNYIDIDLFSGAGGLSIGLQNAGFSPSRFYEIDTYACSTIKHNVDSAHPTLRGEIVPGNVENVDWSNIHAPVRLLAGGAPCQPFSLGGRHLAQHDGRNLFPEVLRALRALKPQVVLLENVRGLLRPSFQPYFEYILRQLECPSIKPRKNELWQAHNERIRKYQCSLGYEPEYHVQWRLLDAADYGVPQNRLRVFIVATRCNLPVFRFPKPTHSKSALIVAQETGAYWEKHSLRRPEILPNSKAGTMGDSSSLPWVTVRDALQGLSAAAPNELTSEMNHWYIPGARSYDGHDGSIFDWPSKTIKAGVHGVPGGENMYSLPDGRVEYFTLRQLARLQTFPDNHYFHGSHKHVTRQIGNAVPCRLAEVLGLAIHRLLSTHA